MSNYIFNDAKEVKVVNEKGEFKFFPQHIAEDSHIMRIQGWRVVEAPKKFEPLTEVVETTSDSIETAVEEKATKAKKVK